MAFILWGLGWPTMQVLEATSFIISVGGDLGFWGWIMADFLIWSGFTIEAWFLI